MPPEFHDGLVCCGGLGGHGDHLDAIIVTGIGDWISPHWCLEDRSPCAKMEGEVWS